MTKKRKIVSITLPEILIIGELFKPKPKSKPKKK